MYRQIQKLEHLKDSEVCCIITHSPMFPVPIPSGATPDKAPKTQPPPPELGQGKSLSHITWSSVQFKMVIVERLRCGKNFMGNWTHFALSENWGNLGILFGDIRRSWSATSVSKWCKNKNKKLLSEFCFNPDWLVLRKCHEPNRYFMYQPPPRQQQTNHLRPYHPRHNWGKGRVSHKPSYLELKRW